MEVAADYAYFYDIAEMTPTSEMTPQPGQDTPQPGQDTPQPGQDTPQPGQDTPQPGQDIPQSRQDTPQVDKSDGKDVKNKDRKSVPVVKNQKISSAVKTGDYANPLLWVIILLLAVTSAGTTVFYKRKN